MEICRQINYRRRLVRFEMYKPPIPNNRLGHNFIHCSLETVELHVTKYARRQHEFVQVIYTLTLPISQKPSLPFLQKDPYFQGHSF